MQNGWKGAVKLRVNADAMTLYAVTDRTWVKDTTLMDQVKEALEGGITFLQLREKHLSKEEFIKEAREMKELSKEYKVPFVINDNIEVALAVDADGVHIGQDDMSVEEARKLLGEDKIIGVSAHNVEEAIKAQKGGADYLGVGAVCATSTKKDANIVSKEEIKKICHTVEIPVVAIGGVKKENINTEHLYVTGNTVIDALDTTVQDNYVFDDAAINGLDPEKRTVLVTTHRRENLGEPMRHVYQAIRDLINEFEDIQVVFPVHKNPKVRQVVQEELGSVERVTLIDPLDYEPFANLMAKSYLILTDSGGIQEEAPALGKPVLVLRDTTERPEAVEAGTVRLVGTDKDAVHAAAHELLSNTAAYKLMSNSVNPYGDGKASERIIQALRHEFLGDPNRPERFGK